MSNRKIILSLMCSILVSCGNLQAATNAPQRIITTTPSAIVVSPTITSTPPASTVTEEIFIQNGIEQNYHQFGNLYIMNGCPHSGGIFGVQLSNSNNLPSWWGISFSEPYDVSKYQNLNFWVKGFSGGESFIVGIEDQFKSNLEIDSDLLNINISKSEWQLVEVSLNSETLETNVIDKINSFVIGVLPSDSTETICVDDIYFS